MTPALFALVDAVLSDDERRPLNHNAWNQARNRLGWWRSLWPMGGA